MTSKLLHVFGKRENGRFIYTKRYTLEDIPLLGVPIKYECTCTKSFYVLTVTIFIVSLTFSTNAMINLSVYLTIEHVQMFNILNSQFNEKHINLFI